MGEKQDATLNTAWAGGRLWPESKVEVSGGKRTKRKKKKKIRGKRVLAEMT